MQAINQKMEFDKKEIDKFLEISHKKLKAISSDASSSIAEKEKEAADALESILEKFDLHIDTDD